MFAAGHVRSDVDGVGGVVVVARRRLVNRPDQQKTGQQKHISFKHLRTKPKQLTLALWTFSVSPALRVPSRTVAGRTLPAPRLPASLSF